MMITISEETMKELLDRSWLCDVYGRRLMEIKKTITDSGLSDLDTYKAILEIVK